MSASLRPTPRPERCEMLCFFAADKLPFQGSIRVAPRKKALPDCSRKGRRFQLARSFRLLPELAAMPSGKRLFAPLIAQLPLSTFCAGASLEFSQRLGFRMHEEAIGRHAVRSSPVNWLIYTDITPLFLKFKKGGLCQPAYAIDRVFYQG
jgi:hypothetical protein